MNAAARLPRVRLVGLLTVPFLLACPGCRERKDDVRIQTLEGKVEKIVVNPDGTGELTVVYFSDKHDREIAGTGRVTKETEIVVNGTVATLKDMREGERVRGEVRLEKKGGEKIQTVLKVYVDRPKPVGGSG